ncbi:MAG TPA: PAS domain-containing protein [Roseiarcus sp.]|nr:PAS domain-containing protein [Roseiarcus sp.]
MFRGGGSPATAQREFPLAGGETAALIRAFDWSQTSLGPISDWPAHLKAALRLMLPAAAQIVLFWGPDFVALYNDAYAPTIGDKHPRALGRPARENWRELWDDLEPLLRRVMETGETVSAKDRPFCIERRGYPENVYFDISYSPVHDEAGGVAGVLCIVNETTERVDARQDLMMAQERLSLALDAAGTMGVFDWDVRTDQLYADERFAINPAKAREGAPIAQYLASIHPDDADRVREGLDRAVATGEKFIQEYRLLPESGATRWVETRGKRHFDREGKPTRFIGVVVDITDQKEAQERQRLILQEMNHRVKNVLAVFQGLINLSARSAQTPQEMAQSLYGRLEALMRAKDLVRPSLAGEKTQSERTTVGALVRTILQPYADGQSAERTIATGPEIAVGANAATSLALALHESATNATKYGALSEPNGAIRVEWRIVGDSLRLEWEERGGPPISAPPQAHGFGAILVNRSIAGQLGGTIDYDWRAAGLKLTLVIPLARLEQ